ncbi:MAG: TonB-dependent receptor, partial [Salinimicrobium sediminis]|nr:TonB-dependent receptor [Salinimicrobium sediminis]
MRLFTSLALLLVFSYSSAQKIVVLDKETKQPIFNVAIFNKDKSKHLFTGFDGEADLSQFSAGEIIFFRHVSHTEFHAIKRLILQQQNKVFLEPSRNELTEVVLSVSRFE